MSPPQPMPGGYSGETFAVEHDGRPAVLRLYARRPDHARIDAALMTMLNGLLPVPQVLDAQWPVDDEPAWLLFERLPGVNAQTWWDASPSVSHRQRAVDNLTDLLVRLNWMPLPRAGEFADATLAVRGFPNQNLSEFYDQYADRIGLDPGSEAGLRAELDHATDLIIDLRRVCLCHSDFNLKNALIDEQTAEITGLVDWEFAHAGGPLTDLGNLLRDRSAPDLVTRVIRRFRDRAPKDLVALSESELLAAARAADLYPVIELASRAGSAPGNRPAQHARAILDATSRDGLAASRPLID